MTYKYPTVKNITLVFTILINICVSAQIPKDGLVGYYKFNNTLWDYSGNNYHGLMLDTLVYSDGPKCQALVIENNNVNAAQINYKIIDGLEDFTISFYAKINGYNNSNNLLSCANSFQANEFLIGYNTVKYNEFKGWHLRINNDIYSFQDTSMNDLNWHHIVISRGNNKAQLYVDHEKSGPEITVSSKKLNINASGVIIGQDQDCLGGCFDHDQNWNGEIDELIFYNKTLESNQFDSLENEFKCQITDTILIYDSITFTDTITVYDSIAVTDTLLIDITIAGLNNTKEINTVKIFPNPAHDILYINTGDGYNGLHDYQLKIVSSTGKTIFESLINQNEFSIDISEFGATGLYFVYIIDDNHNIFDIKKLVLK